MVLKLKVRTWYNEFMWEARWGALQVKAWSFKCKLMEKATLHATKVDLTTNLDEHVKESYGNGQLVPGSF